jgi:hypothetical protein
VEEFRAAGFTDARIVRTCRNARTRNRRVLVAEVVAAR